ncbi:MAG: UbiX family flavin prenyltransferase [Acidobacteria bacterium]|nr:UbiX family flavin prenyltransferase [Acidobacteriota bacterium]
MERRKRVTIGVTGASGAIYAQRLLQWLEVSPAVERIDLVITQAGVRVVGEELGINVAGTDPRVAQELIGRESSKVVIHSANDIGASIASGSYLSDAMVILPCSMGTLGAIAGGVTRDLVHRAADVVLKERRLLIIVPRETPLNEIHLENMLRLARMGVRIVPAMPSFYHFPKSIDDLIDHFCHRLLDHLGIEHEQLTRWEGSRPAKSRG